MPEQTGSHTPDETNCLYEITKAIHATMDRFEREMLIEALKNSRGNMRKAAMALKTTERIFGYKVQKCNINLKRFR